MYACAKCGKPRMLYGLAWCIQCKAYTPTQGADRVS